MITLISGIDTAKSRQYYIDLRQKAENPVNLEGSTLTLNDIIQAMEGQGLFITTQQLFIEELFSKKRPSKELDSIVAYMNKHHEENEIVIWESKDVTPKQEKSFKSALIKTFDVPKSIFPLLDSLMPGSAKKTLLLLHQALQNDEIEFIFFMLVRHFRILLALSEVSEITIDEAKRLAPWQKTKMQKQASSFGKEKLKEIYLELFTLEVGMKTGGLSLSLTQSLDLLLLRL